MLKRLQTLNGWRRLWIVVAVVGFLCTIWQSIETTSEISSYQHDADVLSAFEKPACKYIVDMTAGNKLDQKFAYNDPCLPLYFYRSTYTDAANTQDGYLKHINSLHRQAILKHFGAFLLIYYLPGIGLLYFAGMIAAWVVKGFRPQGTE